MGRIRQFSPSSVTSRLTLFFITISIITSSSLLAKYTFDQTTSSYGHDYSHDDADEEYVKENGTDDGDGDGGGGCALHSGWDGLLGFPIMSTGLRARKGAYAHSMYNVQWINRSIDFSFPWALHVIKQFIVQYLLILLKLFTDPIYVCWMPFEMLFPNIWHHRCNFQMKGLFRWKRNNRGWHIGTSDPAIGSQMRRVCNQWRFLLFLWSFLLCFCTAVVPRVILVLKIIEHFFFAFLLWLKLRKTKVWGRRQPSWGKPPNGTWEPPF